MKIIRYSKLVFLALGATIVLVGCKSDEENPATPDMLRKMDADRSGFKPGASGAPASGSPASGATSTPGGTK